MTQTLPIGTTIVNKFTGVELTIVRQGHYARIMRDFSISHVSIFIEGDGITENELASLLTDYDCTVIDDYMLTNGQRLFPAPTYRIGQRFMNGVTEYILANTPSGVTLINLESGEYHRSPAIVDDVYNITEAEFNQMHVNCMELIGE